MVRYFGPHPLKQAIREKPERYGWKVWCLATAEGELLACQPYAGLKTKIKNNGLGQGPDVVLSLSEQYGLKKGTKVACDNLFTSFDFLDHMGEHGWGVVGTVRQNRLVGVPMPTKKQAKKEMTRGTMKSVYDNNNCVTIWMDSKAVVLASNYTGPNPAGICERYSGKDKAYIKLSCPRMVIDYNKTMDGVDLFNQNTKNYSISTRLKKWYWSLWTWFLNV
ncbi:piggyBac transposable element-derived protein 3-like [Hydra vulgaris]|uniref:PiggyBac transposable element-derived protein 3-like n=1 Tax=Hydra vulgaris TaxID=6087 RepID=A0ABM4B2X4_HYDVU